MTAYGSDVVVDLLRAAGIEHVAINPGATYRGLHDSRHAIGREEGRRATTEVDGRQLASGLPQRQLGEEKVRVAGNLGRAPADGHEVAVGADQAAEGHVDVEVVRGKRHAPSLQARGGVREVRGGTT